MFCLRSKNETALTTAALIICGAEYMKCIFRMNQVLLRLTQLQIHIGSERIHMMHCTFNMHRLTNQTLSVRRISPQMYDTQKSHTICSFYSDSYRKAARSLCSFSSSPRNDPSHVDLCFGLHVCVRCGWSRVSTRVAATNDIFSIMSFSQCFICVCIWFTVSSARSGDVRRMNKHWKQADNNKKAQTHHSTLMHLSTIDLPKMCCYAYCKPEKKLYTRAGYEAKTSAA